MLERRGAGKRRDLHCLIRTLCENCYLVDDEIDDEDDEDDEDDDEEGRNQRVPSVIHWSLSGQENRPPLMRFLNS